MSKSLTSSLMDMLDSSPTSRMAVEFDSSEGAITYALKSAFASIFAGLVSKIDDPTRLREVFSLIRQVPPPSFTPVSTGETEPGPLLENGQRLLSTIFGGMEGAVVQSISLQAGLSSGVAPRIVAAASRMILIAISKRVHEQRIRFSGFGNMLQREAGDFSSYLPSGLNGLWKSSEPTIERARHTEYGAIEVGAFARALMFAVGVGAILLLVWSFSRNGSRNTADSGAADNVSRARARADRSGNFVDRQLPGDIRLNIRENGMESQLLSYIQERSRGAGERYFVFDRLDFEAASAIPKPESEEQLNNIAAILKAYPHVRVRVGGYTDNAGDRKANHRLSENRAEAVLRELTGMGIDRSRLEAEGYGDQHPIASNSTEEGRAKNRRIVLTVLTK